MQNLTNKYPSAKGSSSRGWGTMKLLGVLILVGVIQSGHLSKFSIIEQGKVCNQNVTTWGKQHQTNQKPAGGCGSLGRLPSDKPGSPGFDP